MLCLCRFTILRLMACFAGVRPDIFVVAVVHQSHHRPVLMQLDVCTF